MALHAGAPNDGGIMEPVGSRALWIGANFWSRTGGPRMWTRYDPTVVREELRVLAHHGCNVTRSFCYWPEFVPTPGVLDATLLERFADFLHAHRELNLQTIPTFIVGHMSGENWDPTWRRGRDLYRDVSLVAEQAWFAAEFARRFAHEDTIAAWLISNEMPLYGGGGSEEEIAAWAQLLVQAVRSSGATQPISLGDGAWGIEVSGNDNGYSLRRLAPIVDFLGPHVYPMQDDQLRQFLSAAFACELCGGFERPVVLEEFGLSSDFASEPHAAAYYRQVLYSTLLGGARGWIAWNNADYDALADEDPYRHHVFEMHFGLTDRLGRPKAQLHELHRFSEVVGRLGHAGLARKPASVGLVVPEVFERVLPFTSPEVRAEARENLLQAYSVAREADLPVSLVRERDGLVSSAHLYLLPSTKILTGPGLARLRALAASGAHVYLSYFAGSTAYQRGPWLTFLEELFGVRHGLRYGLVDPIDDEVVTFELLEPLGSLEVGTTLQFLAAGNASARAALPVEAVSARVVAVDQHGRPALVRHDLGGGVTWLCTYPLEHMAARRARANPEDTWRLYAALGEEAGLAQHAQVADPRVLVGELASDLGDVVVLANWCDERIEVALELPSGRALSDLSTSQPIAGAIALDPFAVTTLLARP